jgi:hypothetical protein
VNNCIDVCRDAPGSQVCSKTVLIDVKIANSDKQLRCLCIIDKQSDSSFCDPKVPAFFNLKPSAHTYTLITMSGYRTSTQGEIVEGLQVKGVTERVWITLPSMLTHASIPDTRGKVASLSLVATHPHEKHLACNFPEVSRRAEVLLLVGANRGKAMFTKLYGAQFPFVHHTALGWPLVGPVCQIQGQIKEVKVFHTAVPVAFGHFNAKPASQNFSFQNFDTAAENPDDAPPGLSRDDQRFLETTVNGIKVNKKVNLGISLSLKDDTVLPSKGAACIVSHTHLYEVSAKHNNPLPIFLAILLTLCDSPNRAPPEVFSQGVLLKYGQPRWDHVQYLLNQFWSTWRRRCLSELQERHRWKKVHPCKAVIDIVLLRQPPPETAGRWRG